MNRWLLFGIILTACTTQLVSKKYKPSRKLFKIYTNVEEMESTAFTLHSIYQSQDLKKKPMPKNNKEILEIINDAGYQDQTLKNILKLDTIRSRMLNDSSLVVYALGPDGVDDRAIEHIDLHLQEISYNQFLLMKGDIILSVFELDSWLYKDE